MPKNNVAMLLSYVLTFQCRSSEKKRLRYVRDKLRHFALFSLKNKTKASENRHLSTDVKIESDTVKDVCEFRENAFRMRTSHRAFCFDRKLYDANNLRGQKHI